MSAFSVGVRLAQIISRDEAEKLGAETIEVEHLFVALCKSDRMSAVKPGHLPWFGQAEIVALTDEIRRYGIALHEGALDPIAARRRARKAWADAHRTPASFGGHRSDRCRAAYARAEALGTNPVTLPALMWAILVDSTSQVGSVLNGLGVSQDRLAAVMLAAATRPAADLDVLTRFGRDLTALAAAGKLQPAIGRNDEIKQVARILLQAKKRNPVLVGEPGTGKTAIVEGLAATALRADMPAQIKDIRIVEISLGALIAGTEYRGQFEQRLHAVIRAAESDPRVVLFIDEIHTVVGAGAIGHGSLDAANILKPALARGSIRCIGATTTAEYRKHVEPDAALERRFQVVWVEEPTRDQALAILRGIKPRFEDHHGIVVGDDALVCAVDLAIRHLQDHRLPDKAIDLVDQACARAVLRTLSPLPPSPETQDEWFNAVGAEDVAAVVAQRCRIPVEQITADEAARLFTLADVLTRRVIGQDDAIRAVADTVRGARVGMKDPQRPMAVFLFIGPTGTGKTELAKALAEALFGDERRLIRFDMSEFVERHAIAKLIGAPPGYVGHDAGGPLVDRIRSTPHAVVLFDEIEKAHPDVHNLFLQMFDEGVLTDARGRRGSFTDAIIIMTSNLGASEALDRRLPIGFRPAVSSDSEIDVLAPTVRAQEPANGERDAYHAHIQAAVRRAFSAEFRNRIHKEVMFYPLTEAHLERILDKILARVTGRLADRRIRIDVTAGARALLRESAAHVEFGARALERTVAQLVEEPLASLIVRGEAPPGSYVRIHEAQGVLRFDTRPDQTLPIAAR